MKTNLKSRIHIDKELYNAAVYKVYQLIFNKKKGYFENKLKKCIGKPKELRKVTSGKFPDSCKLAKLKPIYKKGS